MCRSPLALTVRSMREWRARRSSIWSRKPMPVAIDDVPLPSRSTATSTSVSLVARLTLALRMPAGPRARALYQGRPDFATAAWRQRSGAGEGAPTALHRALISPRSSPRKRGLSLPISTRDPWVPASAGRTEWIGQPRSYSTAKADRPLLLAGRGGSPVFPFLFLPPSRGGWRAERRMFRITPGDPEAPGLTHQRMRPRLSTRHRGICPLSRFSVTGRRGPISSPLRGLTRRPLGGGITTPARKYRIPPHRCDVSRGRPSLDGTDGNIYPSENKSRTIFRAGR